MTRPNRTRPPSVTPLSAATLAARINRRMTWSRTRRWTRSGSDDRWSVGLVLGWTSRPTSCSTAPGPPALARPTASDACDHAVGKRSRISCKGGLDASHETTRGNCRYSPARAAFFTHTPCGQPGPPPVRLRSRGRGTCRQACGDPPTGWLGNMSSLLGILDNCTEARGLPASRGAQTWQHFGNER